MCWDALWLTNQGHHVNVLEPSKALADHCAAILPDSRIMNGTLLDFDCKGGYDAVYGMACFVHLERHELEDHLAAMLAKLVRPARDALAACRPGGVFFTCLKQGLAKRRIAMVGALPIGSPASSARY